MYVWSGGTHWDTCHGRHGPCGWKPWKKHIGEPGAGVCTRVTCVCTRVCPCSRVCDHGAGHPKKERQGDTSRL